jgi:hypothetical protein
MVLMQNMHPELLTELAHAHIDDAVRTASRASAAAASRGAARRRLRVGHRALRHRFPPSVA